MTAAAACSPVLLRVEGLSASYRRLGKREKNVRALQNVSFDVREGETLGLVGESGCGKTTLVRVLARLMAADSGTVQLDAIDVLTAAGPRLLEYRRQMQVVFQDPRGSLDPRMRIRDIIAEPLRVHADRPSEGTILASVIRTLALVGLQPAFADRYPHECSGGQCQRVGIARAAIIRPRLIICDEAVSALDMSIQAQIVNLLLDLQAELGMALLFISHNLPLVRHISHRIGVMHAGRLVELGETDQVCDKGSHPYTRELLRGCYAI